MSKLRPWCRIGVTMIFIGLIVLVLQKDSPQGFADLLGVCLIIGGISSIGQGLENLLNH